MKRFLLLVLVLLGTATGCSFGGLYDTPLPGGAALGDRPYRVTAEFRDVLDLVPQSAVEVGDVPAGRVEKIALAADGRTADVTVVLNGDVRLPANATASLRQSSLLGEKFVELAAPDDPQGTLTDGAKIPLAATNRNPQVEEVLGALSMLLNGGGVGQLQEITREVNTALDGREPEVRALLSDLDTFVTGLDSRRDDITRALDNVDQLAGSLAGRGEEISGVLRDLGPGIDVLARQRDQLMSMVDSLNGLSGVATDTITRSKDDLLADLRSLEPTLRQLTAAAQQLPRAMELLLTFPFPDSVLPAIKGDYLNLFLDYHAQTGPPLPLGGS
ncbi:phospholipid/cholesterol/gamma-HCH transport system substrate-binding protein [Amycolatopsis bartoniae]|uniref:ABC transporter substrate-binding protein n=1 Tax=Amycolatopsis bartoniae TaxID=941986 RepID=A0A8H9IS11_9PSEU|nr:MCE family protein [Amycolatopsis bartoniae]MBB2937149.1 phospholipid/cholesterol/gamma-HCH transport system substrate-binding protein [Amycolatopsis bartoniae]TVT06022.1 MCE family protein [Amycolatopsis bartoniae]GHF52795.1 ABC transporter substrate-binding protein [Amycolatopsis bartoniae]